MRNWTIKHQTTTIEIFNETSKQTVCELPNNEQGLNDAQLIAAAPEMLKALQAAFNELNKSTDSDAREALGLVSKALDKARGEL